MMQVAPMFQRKSLARLLQGGALGVVATLAIGFCWGGWVTAGTAREMAQKRAGIAVVAALAPICVEKFQQSAEAAGNLLALKKVGVWRQGTFISNGGWATMSGTDVATAAVADECAAKLTSTWRR
jgi:hypothetical protein